MIHRRDAEGTEREGLGGSVRVWATPEHTAAVPARQKRFPMACRGIPEARVTSDK